MTGPHRLGFQVHGVPRKSEYGRQSINDDTLLSRLNTTVPPRPRTTHHIIEGNCAQRSDDGVDTPVDMQVAAAVNIVGGLLGSEAFATTDNGYSQLPS